MIKSVIEEKHENKIFISWSLTLKCNYSCWYCYQKDEPKTVDVDYQGCIRFIKRIIERYPDKQILVCILGGEVIHYKHIDGLLNDLQELGVKIDITTNGSKPVEWWTKYREVFDNITITYHHGQVDKQQFFDVCKAITDADQKKFINIALMMDPNHFLEIYAFAVHLTQNIYNLIVNCKAIRDDDGVQLKYSDVHRDILVNHHKIRSRRITPFFNHFGQNNLMITHDDGEVVKTPINTFILKQQHQFKGWECYSGIESFYIDHLGDVFGANCCSGEKLGNISGEVKVDNEPIICPNDFCNCRTDLYLTKRKNHGK